MLNIFLHLNNKMWNNGQRYSAITSMLMYYISVFVNQAFMRGYVQAIPTNVYVQPIWIFASRGVQTYRLILLVCIQVTWNELCVIILKSVAKYHRCNYLNFVFCVLCLFVCLLVKTWRRVQLCHCSPLWPGLWFSILWYLEAQSVFVPGFSRQTKCFPSTYFPNLLANTVEPRVK